MHPRKVHFFPATGKVQMKRLHVTPNDTVLQKRERDYLSELSRKSGGGDIEIFSAPR